VTTEDRSGVDAEGSRRWFGRAVLLGAPIAAAVVLLDGQAASASSGDPWIAGGNASAVTDTLGTTNASSLLIVTGGTERIRVDGTDGRVGIGTTTPSANTALHVRSTTKAFTARVDNSAVNGVSVLANATGAGGRGVTGQAAGTNGSAIAGYGIAPGTDINGVYGESQVANGRGVKGVATATGGEGVRGESTTGNGVHGVAATNTGLGVFGEHTAADGVGVGGSGFIGINGTSASATGFGVQGTNFAVGGEGVRGVSSATGGIGVLGLGTGVGVYGIGDEGVHGETNTNSGVAVKALAVTPGKVLQIGVQSKALGVGGVAVEASGTDFGVKGSSTSGTAVYGNGKFGVVADWGGDPAGAGLVANGGPLTPSSNPIFFPPTFTNAAAIFNGGVRVNGKMEVNGWLVKAAGSFRIDHPQDPANRYLVHSFVESPEMKNVYDGVVFCDDDGEAVVEMPSYFESLNRTFRYQLTCIGGVSLVYIADKIADGRFRIAGGLPGLEVSWQVTGVRQDVFAEAHPMTVEPEKDEADRGYFLHPELFGSDETRRIGFGFNKFANAKGGTK
jgi:hypothetical protein